MRLFRFAGLHLCVAISIGGLLSASVQAQSSPLATVQGLFDAMRAGDAKGVAAAFHPDAQFFSIDEGSDKVGVQLMEPTAFAKAVGEWSPGFADERYGRPDVRVSGRLANVWMRYHFYADGAFHHCGAETFSLVRETDGNWRILTGVDTRETGTACGDLSDSTNLAVLDTIMNQWHHAAATADEDTFFGTLSQDGIYLGTDATERWLRDSMAVWADPYFQRETAWAFTPRERYWYFSDDGQTAWFEEHLDSWMGVVRGSGVLTKVDVPNTLGNHWELRHYNLAMAIPNEHMDAVRMAIDSTATPR